MTARHTGASAGVTQHVESGQTYTPTFDAENRLISVAGDGNLVKKINPNGSKTLFVNGIYSIPFEDEVDKASGGSVTRIVTYYPVVGAICTNNTLYSILKDQLGLESVVTDASGNSRGTQRY